MRIRIPELLEQRGVSAYAVARDSRGRISLSTIYRLRERRGQLETFAADMLEALCDVLGVTPCELLERDENGAADPRIAGPDLRSRIQATAKAAEVLDTEPPALTLRPPASGPAVPPPTRPPTTRRKR